MTESGITKKMLISVSFCETFKLLNQCFIAAFGFRALIRHNRIAAGAKSRPAGFERLHPASSALSVLPLEKMSDGAERENT
jgi:hypothetical protein